jgi:hypothetical protein
MTADAEQTLPLRIVAKLSCGDPVTVLSDSEGYTIRIRTADGRDGYVARMYLTESPASSARSRPKSEGVASDNGIIRWLSGAPGSDQFVSNGTLVESLTANGITVQVSLQDTGWKLRASVAIANESSEQIYVNPRAFTLDELTPKLRALAFQDPGRLAKAVTHQVFWTTASASAPSSAVYVKADNYVPPSSDSLTPNYLAQTQPAHSAQEAVLHEGTLDPQQKVSGAVWFQRDHNPQQLNLRVFVGDQIFEFPLSFSRQN